MYKTFVLLSLLLLALMGLAMSACGAVISIQLIKDVQITAFMFVPLGSLGIGTGLIVLAYKSYKLQDFNNPPEH